MVIRVWKLLLLALAAFPLQAQVRVLVVAGDENEPIVVALREAVLASPSFVMDRDTTHVRFSVWVHPGGGVLCDSDTIKSVSVLVRRIGPNRRGGHQVIFVDAYTVGTESDEARKLLAELEQAITTLRNRAP